MDNKLEKGESVLEGIRMIALCHADDAIAALRDPRSVGTMRDAIHEARRSMKRARSALLLLRPALGDKRGKRLDRRFRRAAALLSEPRDAAAATETLDLLGSHYAGVLRPGPFSELRSHLVEQHTRALWVAEEQEQALERAARRTSRARAKINSATLVWDDVEPVWIGPVRRSFKAARNAMREALDRNTPEAFHSWRKAAKHLRYHLSILSPAWDGHLDRASLLIHELTDLLGEHHDLNALASRLERTPAARSTAIRRLEYRAVRGLIAGRLSEIEEDTAAVGERLFVRRPRKVAKRLRGLWEEWTDDT